MDCRGCGLAMGGSSLYNDLNDDDNDNDNAISFCVHGSSCGKKNVAWKVVLKKAVVCFAVLVAAWALYVEIKKDYMMSTDIVDANVAHTQKERYNQSYSSSSLKDSYYNITPNNASREKSNNMSSDDFGRLMKEKQNCSASTPYNHTSTMVVLVSSPSPSPSPSPSISLAGLDGSPLGASHIKAPISQADLLNSTSDNVSSPSHSNAAAAAAAAYIPKWPLSKVELELIGVVDTMKNGPPRTSLHSIELDPSIYRNLSHFLKSYELMEKMLKIYVYKEGKGRLVHTGPVLGIYSSEGLFIRQMERGRHAFRTTRPEEALLFFMPYSVANMVDDLYQPGSKSMHPLSVFIASYIHTIAAAHPFWNRTHGADHFFVACHDWGTLVTQEHEELKKNVKKVVCNADNMGGFFEEGKDVSLPEFYMHSENLEEMGMEMEMEREREKEMERDIERRVSLAFFAGRMHGRVRPKLLEVWKYPKGGEEMQIYGVLDESLRNLSIYEEHMRRSKFCVCPMGYEVNSPRIVEAIHAGCVPVVIADGFVLPFSHVLDWSSFSVLLPEDRIPDLKSVLSDIPASRYRDMRRRLVHVRRHFTWHPPTPPRPFDAFHMILHALWTNHLHHTGLLPSPPA